MIVVYAAVHGGGCSACWLVRIVRMQTGRDHNSNLYQKRLNPAVLSLLGPMGGKLTM